MLTTAIALTAILTLTFSPASRSATPAQQEMLSAMGVDSSTDVHYKDAHGDALTVDEFMEAIGAGQNFDMMKNPVKHTATLQLSNNAEETLTAMRDLPLKRGDAIPEFKLSSLRAREVTNAALQDHFTLMSFFFSTCAPCIAEVPALNAYARKHKDVATMAVTFDDPETAAAFASKWHFNWQILANAQNFVDRIGIKTYPLLVLIDPKGKVQAATLGSDVEQKGKRMTGPDLARWIAKTAPRTSAGSGIN
jgi:cytochrome oxidase Cu insertion factor (SCO1/SenC/PrrC family)